MEMRIYTSFFWLQVHYDHNFQDYEQPNLKILGNICAHLFLKSDCNYGHHHSKARYKHWHHGVGGCPLSIVYIVVKKLLHGFQCCSQRTDTLGQSKGCEGGSPCCVFFKPMRDHSINDCLPEQDMISVRSCYTKCSYSHKC